MQERGGVSKERDQARARSREVCDATSQTGLMLKKTAKDGVDSDSGAVAIVESYGTYLVLLDLKLLKGHLVGVGNGRLVDLLLSRAGHGDGSVAKCRCRCACTGDVAIAVEV